MCPITTHLTGAFFYRVPMGRDAGNGLREDSEVEIDLIQAIRQERIRNVIGSTSPEVMTVVDQALRRWFSL